jgi:hypothetical protein
MSNAIDHDRNTKDERFYSFYKKHYRPEAPSMAQHRQALKKLGFNEEKAMIVNWGSTKLDTDCLARILRDEDGVVVDRSTADGLRRPVFAQPRRHEEMCSKGYQNDP